MYLTVEESLRKGLLRVGVSTDVPWTSKIPRCLDLGIKTAPWTLKTHVKRKHKYKEDTRSLGTCPTSPSDKQRVETLRFSVVTLTVYSRELVPSRLVWTL